MSRGFFIFLTLAWVKVRNIINYDQPNFNVETDIESQKLDFLFEKQDVLWKIT